MADVAPPLPSPGVGSRRKGPKTLPKLPLSAFSPPNTGTSDRFPLPPSPSAVHPANVVDAQAQFDADSLNAYESETADAFGKKLDSAVVSLPSTSVDMAQTVAQE